jgi:hypothetical protein
VYFVQNLALTCGVIRKLNFFFYNEVIVFFFSMYLILPAALWSWSEMGARNLPGGKARPVRKAENLTTICEPIV